MDWEHAAAELAKPLDWLQIPYDRRGAIAARFWSMVSIKAPHECWEWLGNKPDGRYGHFSIDRDTIKAHRLSHAICIGPIQPSQIVRHKCDNPGCVNPWHLEVGTHRDNTRDKFERGRAPDRQGEKHPLSKITETDVRRIRKRAELGEPQESIARDYPISPKHVGKIVRRETWRHI